MSRSKHALKSEQWYGGWAQYIRNENRDARKHGMHKAEQNRARIEAEQLALELDALHCAEADDVATPDRTPWEQDEWERFLGFESWDDEPEYDPNYCETCGHYGPGPCYEADEIDEAIAAEMWA